MKIAIISDTHDNVLKTKKCLEELSKKGIKQIFHLGDFCSPFMIDLFKEFNVKAVLGNNDADVFRIMTKIKNLEFKLQDQLYEINVGNNKVALYHGTSKEIVEAVAKSGLYDVLCHGHTHKVRNEKIGKTLVLNPRTLNNIVSPENKSTYMILDSETLEVKLIEN